MNTKHQVLKQTFGYDSFLTGQEQLIDSIMSGRDTLGIMPTGAGKSACFQIPALMLEGITLIISPLISLMKDQVNALTQAGVKAAFINSSLSERQMERALDGARSGIYKIIYIAPERLSTDAFLHFAQNANISMLTVDEAHCISQWGQDFRPSYADIPAFVDKLRRRPIVSAFTATATPKVREDIVELLRLKSPTVLITGFDRPNLYFEVQKPKDKFEAVADFLKDKAEKSGIIYCSTRAAVEEVCEKLCAAGFSASRYHAGLADSERHSNQDDFLYDKVKIMVATNAFGMGIDKSNVTFVIHYNMPKDIESYYQEAGRAGRDGQSADCILLFSGQDVRTNLWLIENNKDKEYQDAQSEEILKERDRKRLREMTLYCSTNDCLRAYILQYFGEAPPNACGNCGNCNTDFEIIDVTVEAQKILSCVTRMGERYGAKMLIDVLRGSKNEKILHFGLNTLSTYGISSKSDKQLRDIIDYLILNDYLLKTDAEYPIIKLGGRAELVLRGQTTAQMKLSKKQERTYAKSIKMTRAMPVSAKLFAALRKLRADIAREQSVPAFTVFSDTALTDMCMKMPVDAEEFLKVSGVGQVKLERYGKRFLQVIAQNAEAEVPQSTAPQTVEISEETVTISNIADRINCVLLQTGEGKVSGRKLNDWLVSKGYLHPVQHNGKLFKVATEQGIAAGIVTREREIRGEGCLVCSYGKDIQEIIVSSLKEIQRFEP